MNTIFDRYKLWSKWGQLLFIISVYFGIYCVLSVISFALVSKVDFFFRLYESLASGGIIQSPTNWVIMTVRLLNGIGMSVVTILLFRLISLTYFGNEAVGKSAITLTAIYSQFGIYVFINFMIGFTGGQFQGLVSLQTALKAFFLVDWSDFTFSNEWLLFDNVLKILSIAIVVIIILQILYLQHSQAKSTTSAAYWKVVLYLASAFCAAYIFFTSLPINIIPVTGGGNDDSLVVYITAITGLVSAVTALYTQILAGKKLRMEMELLNAQKVFPKGSKSSPSKKNTKQRKSK